MTTATTDSEGAGLAPEPGVHEGVSNEEYHGDITGCLSKSKLWKAVHEVNSDGSLRLDWSKYRYFEQHGEPESKARGEGDALHCLLLDPHEFDQRFIMSRSCSVVIESERSSRKGEKCGQPGVKYVKRKGEDAYEWRCGVHSKGQKDHRPPECTLLDHITMRKVRDMAASARAHRLAGSILANEHKPELTIIGECPITGLPAKCRLDIWQEFSGGGRLIDVKKTAVRKLRKGSFLRDFVQYGYAVQYWLYGTLAAQQGLATPIYPWVMAIGDTPLYGDPDNGFVYPVECWPIGDDLLDVGRRQYEQLATEYMDCREQDTWPGLEPDTSELQVPGWMEVDDDY